MRNIFTTAGKLLINAWRFPFRFLLPFILVFTTGLAQAQTISFSPAGPFCVGSTITVNIASAQNGNRTYSVGVYNGNAPTSAEVQVLGTINTTNPTNAGSGVYILTNASVGSGRYIGIKLTTGNNASIFSTNSFTVNALPSAPTSGGNKTVIYGSANPVLSASVPTGQTINWYNTATGGAPIAAGTTYTSPETAAGTYTYYAEAQNTGCGSATRTAVTLTINKKLITVTATGQNKIYDGNTTATVVLTNPDNIPVSYTTAAFSNNDKNVGTHKPVTVSGISITGAAANNYTLANPTATTTAAIISKAITGSFTAQNKTYDGNTNAVVLTRSVVGTINGDAVNLINGSATFNNADAGTGKPVTLTGAALDGPDAFNYTLSSVATTTATIFLDSDADNIADTNDLDDDNDGIPDAVELNGDRDGDGLVNAVDLDSDGDGITDAVEAKGQTPPPSYYSTSTGRYFGSVGSNGLLDMLESTPDSGTLAAAPLDTDQDKLFDFLDLDADNDGLSDNLESQGNDTARKFPAGSDADQDGIDDQYDASSGGMGISPIQSDNDDSKPDYLDVDSDSDQKKDFVEAYDLNKDGRSLDDLKNVAATFSTNAGNTPAANYYANENLNANSVPGWLQDEDQNGLLNYLDVESSYYHDSDNDGWIDLFDVPVYSNELKPNKAFRENITIVVLPVELQNFKALVTKNGNLLTWQTAAERQNNYFLVERSTNGITFETIGKITGAGDSYQVIEYSFADNNALSGTTYYRLKQVSFSKQTTTSKIVAVESLTIAQISSRAYPNPTHGAFNLNVTLPAPQTLTILIRETNGKLIRTQTVEALTGSNIISLDLSQVATGVYLVSILGNQVKLVQYVVKN